MKLANFIGVFMVAMGVIQCITTIQLSIIDIYSVLSYSLGVIMILLGAMFLSIEKEEVER